MKLNSTIAAALLMASGFVAAQAFAQTPPAQTPAQQRLAALKAQRDAKIAAAKAQQNQIQRPVPTATPTVAPVVTAAPTVTPTAVATAKPTAAPTVTATPTAAASASAAAKTAASAGSATAAPSASAVAPKPPAIIGLDLEELKKTRPDRRKAEIQSLQARWGGELLRNTNAAAELKQHALRTAYLQRIRALASKANDAKTVQAVDILITKEDTRDADAMNALRSGALPTVAAGAGK